jgi:hypothetical protein
LSHEADGAKADGAESFAARVPRAPGFLAAPPKRRCHAR